MKKVANGGDEMSFRMVTWTPPDELRAGGRRAIPAATTEMVQTGLSRGWNFSGNQRIWPVHGRTGGAVTIECEEDDEAQPLTGKRRSVPSITLKRLISFQLFGMCMLILFGLFVFLGLGIVCLRVNDSVATITNEMKPGISRMRDSSLTLLNSTTALMESSNLVAKSAHDTGMVNSSAEVANLVAKLLRRPQITINLGS
tara:strand:+ start:337 stop:933 length:597 start_codon:yes stop_codon:yes gene_type:complete